MLRAIVQRRAVRRAVQTRCHAVNMSDFRLLAERVLDLSTRGMLVACDAPACVGDRVLVSFQAPGGGDLWLDAEAIVARVITGQRWAQAGCGAGLEFTYFEKSARHELLSRLAGFPPPVPQHRDRRSCELRAPLGVLMHPSSSVPDIAVVAQAQRRHGAPRGAFS